MSGASRSRPRLRGPVSRPPRGDAPFENQFDKQEHASISQRIVPSGDDILAELGFDPVLDAQKQEGEELANIEPQLDAAQGENGAAAGADGEADGAAGPGAGGEAGGAAASGATFV